MRSHIVTAAIAVLCVLPLTANQARTPPVIKVCGLLPTAEVKKLIGGNQVFDMMPPEEEALGTYGSSCNYPGVLIQVMSFNQSTIDSARKRGGLETITGVGDEAYAWNNPAGYLELYVKVGARFMTLQRSIDRGKTAADVRPGTIALAKALVPKLTP